MPRLAESYTRHPRPILWLVRGGLATIGGTGGDTEPSFRVRVDSFYLSKRPVTNLEFEAYRGDFVRAETSAGDSDPALGVGFAGAAGYCAWYARVSRKPMRLPTEIEWEYACRGGDDAAARGGRNPFGLIGMPGGVWEWASTAYVPYPLAVEATAEDLSRPRVLRGGPEPTDRESHPGAPCCCRRRHASADAPVPDAGFRVARSLE